MNDFDEKIKNSVTAIDEYLSIFATRAKAVLAAVSMPDGENLEVEVDESLNGQRIRYRVQSGELIFVANLDQLRVDLENDNGGSYVSAKLNLIGAVPRNLLERAADRVHVRDFGALGNGISDDLPAIVKAINSGAALDWGGPECIYLVNGFVNCAIAHSLNWKSSGAKIIQGSSSYVECTIGVTVKNGDHCIDGYLEIDARKKSAVGFRIQNLTSPGVYPDGYPNFKANNLRVENIYRANNSINVSAEGVAVRGAFDNVVLENAFVKNSSFALSAGVEGAYGSFGISIVGNNFGQPQNVRVINPSIFDIYSEDPTYTWDQDGIRIILSADPIEPSEPSVRIEGGIFHNCWGRSIKSQTENTTVVGTRFIRKTGFSRGNGNYEIDFQEGGGRVRDIECMYIGTAPQNVVNFSTTRQTGKNTVPFSSIDGAEVILGHGAVLESFLINTIFAGITEQIIRATGVNIRGVGVLTYFARFSGDNGGSGFHLLLDDNTGAPIAEWVQCPERIATGSIRATRQVNTGSTLINMRRSNFIGWRPIVSAKDCIGFNVARNAENNVSSLGVLERIGSLVNEESTGGGILRTYSFRLAGGAIFQFPVFGGNTNIGLLIVSANGAKRCGVFSRDTSGVYALAAGSDIIGGNITEPLTGLVRLWFDPASGTHVLKNAAGGERSYVCMLIS